MLLCGRFWRRLVGARPHQTQTVVARLRLAVVMPEARSMGWQGHCARCAPAAVSVSASGACHVLVLRDILQSQASRLSVASVQAFGMWKCRAQARHFGIQTCGFGKTTLCEILPCELSTLKSTDAPRFFIGASDQSQSISSIVRLRACRAAITLSTGLRPSTFKA